MIDEEVQEKTDNEVDNDGVESTGKDSLGLDTGKLESTVGIWQLVETGFPEEESGET